MDIEPLWALGGWLFLFVDCMAAPKTPSTVSDTYAKSHSLIFLFLTLFFIFLLLVNPTTNPINSSNVTSSIPFKRLLLSNSSKSTSSTMNLHPKKMQNAHTSSLSSSSSSKSSRREFGAAAHEVPSGPNPISNREGRADKKGIWSAEPK
ncbi:hypothetical protein CRYUN_Cryun14cG0125200 [Craigia yunnanensis]